MSNVIEDRIVEMKFDNADFEKNVATSMNTLDRLKQALDFSKSADSFKGVQNAANDINNISFNGISESLASIQERFSTMGIIGMTIIQNLTSSALSAIANVGSRFFGMISQGGINRAMNIEKAKFQLEGLGIAYQDVYDEIDYAVTNTSFSLDAAAQAAAQLSSAGLDYENVIFTHQKDQKELTEMGMALRAVSGVAAQTMTDYDMVARYFQDVANAGKVTGATLTYMTQVLNLPVKQDLAEGLMAIADGSYEATEAVQKNAQKLVGNMEVSAQDIEQFCKDSQIDFDTFSTIMFNKYADHAVEANKTLIGVIDNIKSAFARIGAEFVSPIVEIDGAVVHMLDSFRKKVNEFKGYIVPFAKLTTDSINMVARFMGSAFDHADLKWVEPFFTGLGGIFKGLTWTLLEVKETFAQIFPNDVSNRLKAFADRFKEFGENFGKTYSSFTGLSKVHTIFESFFNMIKSFGNVFKIFTAPFKGFIEGFKSSIGIFKNTEFSITSVFDSITNLLNGSEKLKQIADTLEWFGENVATRFIRGLHGLVSSIQSFKTSGIDGIVDGFFTNVVRNFGGLVLDIIEKLTGIDIGPEVYAKWNNIVKKISDFVKDMIHAFQDGIDGVKEFVAKLKENFGSFHIDTSGFKDFVDGIVEDMNPLDKILQIVENAFRSLASFLRSVIPGILSMGKGLVSGIGSIIKGIWNALKGENLSEGLETALGATFLYNLKNLVSQITKLINPFGGIENAFKAISDSISDITGMFKKQETKADYFIKLASSLLILAFAMSVIAGIDSDKLADATAVIVGLMAELSVITRTISGPDTKSLPTGATTLVAMAAAISILAGAMRKIADIEDPDRLVMACIAIEAFIGSMYIVAKKLSGAEATKMMSGASGLIAMAIAIRILASAAKVFGEMNPDELLKAGAAITVLIAALTAFIRFTASTESSWKAIGKKGSKSFSADNMISIGLGLIALAAAIKILADAAEQFKEMKWEELGKAGAAITVLLAELGAFTKWTGNTKNMISIGLGMIEIAAAMKIFASAADDFGRLNWEQIGKAGVALTGIVTAVALLSKLTTMNSSAAGFFTDSGGFVKSASSQNLIQLGVGLIAFAAAMKIFASAAEDFGYLNWSDLAKSGAALAGLLAGLSLFSHFTEGSNLIKVSAAMVIFAAALLVLVPAMNGISNIGVGGLIASIAAIAGIIAVLATAAKMTEGIQGGMVKLSAALLLFGAGLAAIGAGLTLLSAGVVSAVAVIPAIILLIKETILAIIHTISEAIPLIVETLFKLIDEILNSLEEHVPEIVDSLLNIVIKIINVLTSRIPELMSAISNLVKGFVDAFKINIGQVNPVELIAAMVGIMAFMVILAEAARIAQKSLLGVVAIMAVLAEVALMFVLLSGIDAQTTLAIATGVSATMLALGVTLAIISAIPVAGALQGVASLGIVVAGIVAILAALGAIKQIPGFTWLMDEGIQVLGQIGTAIGTFVGNIVGSFAESMTNSLPKIADNLSMFMLKATPFFAGAKLIDSEALNGVLKLVAVVLALTAANVLDSLTSWLTGGSSFVKFGEELAEFAPYFARYYNTIKDVKPDVVEASANAALALAKMASTLPKDGGIIQWFTGTSDMSEFAEKLVPFGKAMVEYSNAVEGLKVDVVEKSVAAAKAISELANNLPNSGGVAGWFMGENDMDLFGEQLVIFGWKLSEYSFAVKNVDPAVVEKSVAAGKAVSELANNLPNSGGMISWFTGDNDMATFGKQLTAFGTALAEYSQIVSGDPGVNSDVIQKSVDSAQALSALANGLPASGGLADWIFGGNDLQSFGEQLIAFGTSMAAFSETLTGVQIGNITDLITGCTEMINLANMLQGTDTEVLKKFGKDAASFSSSLSKEGTKGVQEFADSFIKSEATVTTAVTNMITNVLTTIRNRIQEFRTIGGEIITEFANGMKSKEYYVRVAANGICQAVINAFNTNMYADKFYQYGIRVSNGFASGITAGEASIKAAADRIIAYGAYISEGFARGMESNLDRISRAAESMVNAADKATRAKGEISSPSRLFKREGEFVPQGFALGISEGSDYVVSASEGMIDAAYEAMSKAISTVYSLLEEDVDYNPVITPVLDLSSITADADALNEMFNRSISVGRVNASTAVIKSSPTSQLDNLQNGQYVGQGNVIFNQNNYSPKALSRIEIYRDTRNLFAQAKGALS